jgi:3'-phosphoadenosine 5'-phosphosulfate sulfotransferase (PAPS reductase)/FAD synthetase
VDRTLPVIEQVPGIHIPQQFPKVALTPTITELLAAPLPLFFSTSGGKDSSAAALATSAYLDEIGHTGPRVLIHSDLGRVEHRASLPMCERLAERLGLELVVVRREAGDLMDRWLVRWQNNCTRYANLACIKLILPWSTASLRFCTSELKSAILARYMRQRFPGQTIIAVSGIRAQESPNRAKAPVLLPQPRLFNATQGTRGYDWHPIHHWTVADVLAYHDMRGFPLHEAYWKYNMSRVSCAFCILASLSDLTASATIVENRDIYLEMVALEIISSFSFQDGQWLGDVAPHLLDDAMRDGLREAKRKAAFREAQESRLPKSLLYVKGWPIQMPTLEEARLLGEVRTAVAGAIGLPIRYTEPGEILDRFAELLAEKELRKGRTEVGEPVEEERASGQQTLWDMLAV